jgi:Protein of unknown function (DUF3617)
MSSRLAAALVCATLFAGAQALAQDATLPKRKPGLWTQTVEFTHLPGQSVRSQQCVDAATDPAGLRRSLSGDEGVSCSVRASRPIGGGVELDMGCNGPQGSSTTVTRVVGDMGLNYRVESQIRYDTARSGAPRESRMVIRANYSGACPAGAQAGEQRRIVAPGQELDESKLQQMNPMERKRALEAAGRPEKS